MSFRQGRQIRIAGILLVFGGCSTAGSGPGFGALRDEGGFPNWYVGTGGTVAGSGGSDGATVACKLGGESCVGYAECCSGSCSNDVCGACAELGASCSPSMPCCSGTCFAGRCRASCGTSLCYLAKDCCSGSCTNGSCDRCGGPGDPCDTMYPCCGGFTCYSAPYPAVGIPECCIASGQPCLSDGECCGRACVNGSCAVALGQPCSPGDPCVNSSCVGGQCCQTLGGSCSAPGDCCYTGQMICGGQGRCCQIETASCSKDQDCCTGTCIAGACCVSDPTFPCSSNTQCCSGACVTAPGDFQAHCQ